MNDHPCTRAFDHQGGTTVPWIIGASIASVTTVSLATFFWSRQAGFWLLALLAASYLPTPVTDPRLKLHGVSSCLWFGLVALVFAAFCALGCWWLSLSTLLGTALAALLLFHLHRKHPFRLPRQAGMTFQRSPSQVGTPLYFSIMLLAFAALGVFALPLTISLLLVFLSLLAASVALWNWAWGIALEPDGLAVYSLKGIRFYPWQALGRPQLGFNNWYLYDQQNRHICTIPAQEAAASPLVEILEKIPDSQSFSCLLPPLCDTLKKIYKRSHEHEKIRADSGALHRLLRRPAPPNHHGGAYPPGSGGLCAGPVSPGKAPPDRPTPSRRQPGL